VKRCILAAFTNPVAGREDEYNEWYDREHLQDVLAAPGFKSAQRFALAEGADSPWRYLAIYEFEGDDPNEIVAGLFARAGTSAMVISPALDSKSAAATPWVAITDKLVRER
jgi:hypothetical protein